MIVLIYGFIKGDGREYGFLRVASRPYPGKCSGNRIPFHPGDRVRITEQLFDQFQYSFFEYLFINVRDDGEGHAVGGEEGLDEGAEVGRTEFPDGGGGAQDGAAQRMAFEEHALELVIDVLGRIVLVGDDLVEDHAALGLDFPVGEGGLGGELEQQAGGLAQVLLQDRGVEDDLLLGGVGVELAAQPVQVAGDDGSALALGPAEDRMLHEMGDAHAETVLVPGPAAETQGAVAHGGATATDPVAESARCCAAAHYRFLEIRRRSSARKPGAFFALTLCRWI